MIHFRVYETVPLIRHSPLRRYSSKDRDAIIRVMLRNAIRRQWIGYYIDYAERSNILRRNVERWSFRVRRRFILKKF